MLMHYYWSTLHQGAYLYLFLRTTAYNLRPCYDGLKNNVATSLMRVKLNAWPKGTPEFVSHTVMKEYIQDTSKKAGAESVTIYGARVTRLRKVDRKWDVTWTTLKETTQSGTFEEQEETAVRQITSG